jgi:site-specific DNA-methyltransferase (adenine-specific)
VAKLSQVCGDVFQVLPMIPSESVHGCVTDPPYGWNFMGRSFDRQHCGKSFDDQARYAGWLTDAERKARGLRPLGDGERYTLWALAWLREVYRVLVPGAFAMVFQGSKSYDLLVSAARLAGFEVLPMVCGITGQAMAQGGNLGKLIDKQACETSPVTFCAADFAGHSTRLRDQVFPVAVLMKPCAGSFSANACRWGVAGFDVDGTRVEGKRSLAQKTWSMTAKLAYASDSWTASRYGQLKPQPSPLGRFPGNVALDAAAAAEVGDMSGEKTNGGPNEKSDRRGTGNALYGKRTAADQTLFSGDSGTAARYFRQFQYLARAPKSERMRGLETWHWVGDPSDPEGWRRVGVEEWQGIQKRHQMVGCNHPTLKALDFARWVARLILPPAGSEAHRIRSATTKSPGRLLVPFSGVLSEAIGAALAGWPEIVAIEASSSYVAQGACRWSAWGPYSAERSESIESTGRTRETSTQGSLFG